MRVGWRAQKSRSKLRIIPRHYQRTSFSIEAERHTCIYVRCHNTLFLLFFAYFHQGFRSSCIVISMREQPMAEQIIIIMPILLIHDSWLYVISLPIVYLQHKKNVQLARTNITAQTPSSSSMDLWPNSSRRQPALAVLPLKTSSEWRPSAEPNSEKCVTWLDELSPGYYRNFCTFPSNSSQTF